MSDEIREVNWLGEVGVRPASNASHRRLPVRPGRKHDDRNMAGRDIELKSLRYLEPTQAGQHDIEQNQVGRIGVDVRERLDPIGRHCDSVTAVLQTNAQQFGDVGIVFDDQNMRHVIAPHPYNAPLRVVLAAVRGSCVTPAPLKVPDTLMYDDDP